MQRNDVIIKLELMRSHGLPATLYYFVLLQFDYGLRISDMLRIKRTDITQNNIISVRQSKGSNSLICHVAQYGDFFQEYRNGLHVDLELFSREYIYRLLKRYGIFIYNGANKNLSVTHSGRKELARSIYDQTGDIKASASALGHKSTNSTLYYLTEAQKTAEIKKGILSNPVGVIGNLRIKKGRNGSILSVI